MAISDKAPFLGEITITQDESFTVVPAAQPIPNPIPPNLVNLSAALCSDVPSPYNPYCWITAANELINLANTIWDLIQSLISLFEGKPRAQDTITIGRRLGNSKNVAGVIWSIEIFRLLND